MHEYTAQIRIKLPSLNDYVRECRGDRYGANRTKRQLEMIIRQYIEHLPTFRKPIEMEFRWIEDSKRRDADNVAFAKKFILDAMVKAGKLPDDNLDHVQAFRDDFEIGKPAGVIVTIREHDGGLIIKKAKKGGATW